MAGKLSEMMEFGEKSNLRKEMQVTNQNKHKRQESAAGVFRLMKVRLRLPFKDIWFLEPHLGLKVGTVQTAFRSPMTVQSLPKQKTKANKNFWRSN